MSLDVDLTSLWDSINTWFPVFFGVLATIGGIPIGIRLATFIIETVKRSF